MALPNHGYENRHEARGPALRVQPAIQQTFFLQAAGRRMAGRLQIGASALQPFDELSRGGSARVFYDLGADIGCAGFRPTRLAERASKDFSPGEIIAGPEFHTFAWRMAKPG